MFESINIPKTDDSSGSSGMVSSAANLGEDCVNNFEPLSYFRKYSYKYTKHYKVYTISSVHLVEAETALAAFIKQKDTSLPTKIVTCLAASLFHPYDCFI